MKHHPLRAAALLSLLIAAAAGQSADPPAVPKHLKDLRALVKALPLDATKYEHGNGEVVWTGKVRAECDCSGLVNHLLQHSYKATDDDLKAWLGSTRPTARRYYDAIADAKAKKWVRVEKPCDAKPGDFIAIKYDERPMGNTGHLMVIDEAPVEMKEPPAGVDGATRQWHVTVIDSSMSGHGKTDTRYDKAEKHTGVGRGVFRLFTDAAGAPVAYTWSAESMKSLAYQKDHHLALGRFVPE